MLLAAEPVASIVFAKFRQQPGQPVEARRRFTVEVERPGHATRTIEQIDFDEVVGVPSGYTGQP